MEFTNFIVPILGFLLFINAGLSLKDGKENKVEKRKVVIDLIIAFLIMISSAWISWDDSHEMKHISNTNDTLLANIDTMINDQHTKAVSDLSFQNFLKDSFNIVRQGDRAVVVTNNYIVPEPAPHLLISSFNEHNPTIVHDTLLSINVSVQNADVYIDSYRFLIFNFVGGKATTKPEIINGSFTKGDSYHTAGSFFSRLIFLNRLEKRTDHFFLVYEVNYLNIKREKQPIFRSMFMYTGQKSNVTIPPIDNEAYDSFERLLKEKNYYK